jgi:hypothetical protein
MPRTVPEPLEAFTRAQLEIAMERAPVLWTSASSRPRLLYASVNDGPSTLATYKWPFDQVAPPGH